jgi:hypothetical protein
MKQEEDYEDDWKKEAPFLAGLGKPAEPEVPDGYFEELPNAVLARIKALAAEERQVVEMPQPVAAATPTRVFGLRTSIFWSAAASIVLLVAVGTFFLVPGLRSGTSYPASIEAETMAQLASLGIDEVMEDLNPASLNDEQLFAMLGSDGDAAFENEGHEITRDEAYEFLQDADLDAIDLQGLDIDMNDLQ